MVVLLLEFEGLPLCGSPVLEFCLRKTPEVNPRSGFTTETPGKPEFFAKQKMRPNEVLKKPLASVNSFWVEALYIGQR
jgi:hypothetical protein